MDQLVIFGVFFAGLGGLLAGLGIFFWGVRHVLAARAELESTRTEARPQRPSMA